MLIKTKAKLEETPGEGGGQPVVTPPATPPAAPASNEGAGTPAPQGDSGLVKTLRSEIERRDADIANLKKEIETAKANPGSPAGVSPETVKQLNDKVEDLTFRNDLALKVPHLAEHSEEILKIRKENPSMSFENVVAQWLGQNIIKSAGGNANISLNSTPIAIPGGGQSDDLSKKSDEELFEIVQRDRRDKGQA